MVSLLITPVTLLVLSLLIKDKDIVLVSRLLSFTMLVGLALHFILPPDLFYIKEASFDILMFSTVFLLRDDVKSFLVGVPCVLSFLLNVHEQFSYYQTMLYPYREYIQFILLQIVLLGVVIDCKWRKLWKTDSQK
jgi:hypothetical protein